jgi:hypothetical protein
MSKTLDQEFQEVAKADPTVAILLHQRDEARLRVNLIARGAGALAVYPIPERYRELWTRLEQELAPVGR